MECVLLKALVTPGVGKTALHPLSLHNKDQTIKHWLRGGVCKNALDKLTVHPGFFFVIMVFSNKICKVQYRQRAPCKSVLTEGPPSLKL